MALGYEAEKTILDRELKDFSPAIQSWINDAILREMVDIKRRRNEQWNATKKWWQRKRPTKFMLDNTFVPPRQLDILIGMAYKDELPKAQEYVEKYLKIIKKYMEV